MTQKELIRQEIERRKKICEGIFERESDTYYQGKAVAYGELLTFIDSLPEEFPPYCTGIKGHPDPEGRRGRNGMVPKDISRRAERYRDNTPPPYDEDDICSAYEIGAMEQKKIMNIIDSLPEEKPSEDLEEAAKEYMKKARKHLFDDSPIGKTDDAFIAGAEWQKAKMLKDAVEGYVTFNRDAQKKGLPCVTVIANEKPMEFYESRGFKLGDKVRIVVLKEEEKQ